MFNASGGASLLPRPSLGAPRCGEDDARRTLAPAAACTSFASVTKVSAWACFLTRVETHAEALKQFRRRTAHGSARSDQHCWMLPPLRPRNCKQHGTTQMPTACSPPLQAPQLPPRKQQGAAPTTPPIITEKPATDVIAGAVARAASQSTIHPLDTIKVRLQAGRPQQALSPSSELRPLRWQNMLLEIASLYKGVLGAATGAGIIIGSYFAIYSNSKRLLRQHTDLPEGSIAFVSGAAAAVGSSAVKVPIAVCIRSVQAGVYPNVVSAAKTIVAAAGVRGLFTGFLPTLLEDVPDMAVKFTVYETFRAIYVSLHCEQPSAWLDLLMGGTAGAAAAAATTPLDVVKTRMMCSASARPSAAAAARGVWEEGRSWRAFFRGVGPRALSNGLNSAIFFCFFEAIRRALLTWQQEQLQQQAATAPLPVPRVGAPPAAMTWSAGGARDPRWGQQRPAEAAQSTLIRGGRSRLACLSLAIPLAFHAHPPWSAPWSIP